MKQFSLFNDDNFEDAPQKPKRVAAAKASANQPLEAEVKADAKTETNQNINIEVEPIPLGDIENVFNQDEKSLEENYIREVFIFEEPEEELLNGEAIAKVEVKNNSLKTESSKPKNTRGRLKLIDTHLAASNISVPDDETLFSKKYYSIGIVAKMFDVNISLLRYWENEFSILKPRKNGKGDRHFRPEDIKNLQLIHHLLREKKYTLEGAKDFLKKTKKTEDPLALIENLKNLKSFLLEIKTNL